MQKLIETIKSTELKELPYSVYTSVKEQHIFNVPVIKPLLIFVLSGNKNLIGGSETSCSAGNFIFLSNTDNITIRNIPGDDEYFALLIEFDFSDFDCFAYREAKQEEHFQGPIGPTLENTLQQFVEWSTYSPAELWHLRRQEILQVLFYLGFKGVAAIMAPPTLSHKLHTILSENITNDLDANALSSMLAMSESTLRRKLNAEGDSLQSIKDRVKLGHGLHLIQTSRDPIARIAEQCGYSSQSRFTDKFKLLFGVTPTKLRKTKMRDLGE